MSYSDGNSYDEILDRVLSNELLISYDKREGSVIYNAVAPLCLELAEAYLKLDIFESQSNISESCGSILENKAYDYGIERQSATPAYIRVVAMVQSEGNTYTYFNSWKTNSVVSSAENSSITYTYVGRLKLDGTIATGDTNNALDSNNRTYEIFKCDVDGTDGNINGDLMNPTNDDSFYSIYGTIQTAGEDEEDDDSLRDRLLEIIRADSFGGNISDYTNYIKTKIDGIGGVRVYAGYKYGGGVLISLVDTQFNPISDTKKIQVKNILDPSTVTEGTITIEDTEGKGIGVAPIGHTVTITTPLKKYINIKFNVTFESSIYTLEQKKTEIANAVLKYFKGVRSTFGTKALSTYAIYTVPTVTTSVLSQNILNLVSVVSDVTDIEYSDNYTSPVWESQDFILSSDVEGEDKQDIPYVYSITVNDTEIYKES